MSSRFRTELLVAALLLAACDQDKRRGPVEAPVGPGAPCAPAVALVPAGGSLPSRPDPRARPYYDSAAAVVEGRRLYNAMNCVGCHFNGGGGIGPPLMDDKWIYGGRLDQIYDTIYHGRANGMPAWGGKLQDDQIWKISAYVRSMSLPATLAANTGGTPSRNPAPVPAAADAHDGWHLPK
jgi:cytochrome c oxidase cbb3-type subunit 3